MTKDERIANYKFSVLQHAREHKNITYTCKVLNLSRTVYYKWLKRFSQLGYLGLQDKVKRNLKCQTRLNRTKNRSFSIT